MLIPQEFTKVRRRGCSAVASGVLLCAWLMLCGSGCSRVFWRTQADYDAYNILMDKTADSRWDLPRVSVQPDPRSRHFDPYDPDCEPLPPDDPSANEYMQVVSGISGYKSWHKFGHSMSIENPQWLEQFGMQPQIIQGDSWTDQFGDGETPVPAPEKREDRRLVPAIENLKLAQAIELANIHSREYQNQIEAAFLSALDLSLEQFQFGVRYLGFAGEPGATTRYIHTPSTRDNLSLDSAFGVRQALPTGGQWIAELSNNTLWLFSGPNQTNTSSVLSYSLVQPLMLGAGRRVVLENLTRTERRVLYDVRTLARFRKTFFGDVVVNGQGGGYFGLLQSLQTVLNNQDNVYSLGLQVERQREINSSSNEFLDTRLVRLPEGFSIPDKWKEKIRYDSKTKKLRWLSKVMTDADFGALSELSTEAEWRQAIRDLYDFQQRDVVTLDIATLQSNLSRQLNNIRSTQQRFADNADRFKLALGLPTDIQMTIDRSFLKPFQLYDRELFDIELALVGSIDLVGQLDEDMSPEWKLVTPAAQRLRELASELSQFATKVVSYDLAKVEKRLPARLEELDSDADRDRVKNNFQRDRQTFGSSLDELQIVTRQMDDVLLIAKSSRRDEERDWKVVVDTLRDVREKLLNQVVQLRSVQALQRSELISLQPFEKSFDDVVETAMGNRLDLMNSRGLVMDARRALEVAANRLKAGLNVVVDGDINTSLKDRPFDFRGNRSTFRTGLQFSAPMDLMNERNAYRAALIAFQRARRTYMQLEDQIKLDVRSERRQLLVLKKNLETSRQNLRFALIQLDSAIERSSRPATAGASGVSSNNLLQAFTNVLNVQNDLISTWVSYEQNRINIHRDMDIMEVDERGLWVDPAYQTDQPGKPGFQPSINEPADAASIESFREQYLSDLQLGPEFDGIEHAWGFSEKEDQPGAANRSGFGAERVGTGGLVVPARSEWTETSRR